MNIIIGLFILCNYKKFFQKIMNPLPNQQSLHNNTNIDDIINNPNNAREYYWGDDIVEILSDVDDKNKTILENKKEKKGYSIDVKSNIYLFIDI
jgi:hypothetical protein